MLKDPVCGKSINRNKAHIMIEYEHVVYFLCCPICQAAFEATPAKYAKSELGQKIRRVEPTPRVSHRR
jgi:YHS domain-containing protein